MKAKDALQAVVIAIDGLQVIQGMTRLGGDKAAAALAAIDKVVASLKDGLDGKASPQAVSGEIDQLFAELVGNDQAADAALKARFGAP